MRPTEILSSEHRVILSMLTCLERIVDAGVRRGWLEDADVRAAIEFFQTFADGCHHAKEEDHLFPALAKWGLSEEAGPIRVMLEDHDAGREQVQGMLQHIEGAVNCEEDDLDAFAHHARAFADLLRDHIVKEDEVLFPLAEQLLQEQDRRAVLAGFTGTEGDHHTHDRMMEIAHGLCESYKVELDPLAAGTSCATKEVPGCPLPNAPQTS